MNQQQRQRVAPYIADASLIAELAAEAGKIGIRLDAALKLCIRRMLRDGALIDELALSLLERTGHPDHEDI